MLAELKQKVRNWRLQRAARQAFQQGLGFARERWPINAMPDRKQVIDSICTWYREQLAQTATPYGIDDYGALLRLVIVQERRTILWEYEAPMFQRQDIGAFLDQITQQIGDLPLQQYPHATHIEAHLVSIGNILVATDQP